MFERIAEGEQLRVLISTPPQHGKSETALHALVWLLLKDPKKRHAYATYAQEFTNDNSLIARRIAERHPALHLVRDNLRRWVTAEGGGVTWTSRGGPLTGRPVDGVLLLDDLLKDRAEANSGLIRKKTMEWLSSTAFSRLHPGASVVLIATRWHLDDPTGQLLEKGNWEYIELPAIKEDGSPLWPEERPLEWLEEQRRELLPNDWSALYMCQPIAEGNHVFEGESWYDGLPEGAYREGHGFDAAYTEKKTADFTVTISGRMYNDHLFLTNMFRSQMEAEKYVPMLPKMGVNKLAWIRSGTEKGLEAYLKSEGIRVEAVNASTDKLNRAIPLAVAWNNGQVHLPRNATWVTPLLNEVHSFTGIGDKHDDIVDAMVALYNMLKGKKPMSRTQRRSLSPW